VESLHVPDPEHRLRVLSGRRSGLRLTVAWTFLSGKGREAFRAQLAVDNATWTRGRGWALWKSLKTLVRHRTTNPASAAECRRVIADVLAEHEKGEMKPG